MKKGNLFACCKVACNEKITMLFMQHFIKKKLYFCPVLASEQRLVNANAFVSWDLFVKLWGTWLFRHMLGNFPIMSHVFFSCYLWLWYVDLKAPLNKCATVDGEAKAAGDEKLFQGRDPEYSTTMKKIHTDVETGQSISPAGTQVGGGVLAEAAALFSCPGSVHLCLHSSLKVLLMCKHNPTSATESRNRARITKSLNLVKTS